MKPQTTHTPGPWRYTLGRGANPRFHIQTCAGYQIACTTELNKHRMAAEENAAREANARLIAAAPELHSIAEELARWESNPDRYAGDLADLAQRARAALSRAKGGAL